MFQQIRLIDGLATRFAEPLITTTGFYQIAVTQFNLNSLMVPAPDKILCVTETMVFTNKKAFSA